MFILLGEFISFLLLSGEDDVPHVPIPLIWLLAAASSI